MMDLPFSKLKIKIHALDNPTSVFKKRNLLSLNCINKSSPKKKLVTPLRTYTKDLPHYMLPTKSNINNYNSNNNNNNKNNTNNNLRPSPHFKIKKLKFNKNNMSDSKIKFPNLSREKSDNILYSKVNINKNNYINTSFKRNIQDISIPNINNNSVHNIKLNQKNNILNGNILNNENIYNNKKKHSLNENINIYANNNFSDTNNEIILTENNNNFQSINNYSSDSAVEKKIPKQFQSIISEMQKKINEQNKLLSDRIKEIENLKKQLNENNEDNNQKNDSKNSYFDNMENINMIKEYKKENEFLNNEIDRYKSLLNDYKKNNQEKNQQNELNHEMIEKLQEELKNLKENIETLSEKYQAELTNNRLLEEKNNYLKNNLRSPDELKQACEIKISQQEQKIAELEEELYQINISKTKIQKCKQSSFEILQNNNNNNKLQLSRTLTREFIVKIEVVDGKMSSNNINNNDETNENIIMDSPSKKFGLSSKNSISSGNVEQKENGRLILNEKEYNKIQLLLNILFLINGITEENITEKISQFQNKKFDNQFNNVINEFCQNLKITNNELIKQFINDFLIKDKKGENVLKDLFKYTKSNLEKSKEKSNFKKIIYEKCQIYDYKNKKTIPFKYFKHLYKENIYNENIIFSENNFFNIIYDCKLQDNNNIYSLYDIFYENLMKNNDKNDKKEEITIKGEKVNNDDEQVNLIKDKDFTFEEINISKENKDKNLNLFEKINPNYKFKYKDIINTFLDKVIKEAIKKQKDDESSLVRARSYDQDLFGKFILQSNNNISKLNKSISDGEENDFEI